MSPHSDAVSKIREQLQLIEDGGVEPYAGFKQICFIADVYMVWSELCVTEPDNQFHQQENLEMPEQGLVIQFPQS